MKQPFWQRHAAKLVLLFLVSLLFLAAAHREDPKQAQELASGLRFEVEELHPAEIPVKDRSLRQVNPHLRGIESWISSVGAAIALADIEGSGRPADICLVDTRNDSVTVMPAPGTGSRFRAFALALPFDGYDPRTIAPMGCLPADVNEDGRMDLLVYFWGRTPIAFLRNDIASMEAAAFTPVDLVSGKEVWFTNAMVLADVDGDGHADVIVGNYFRDDDAILDSNSTVVPSMQHSMSRAFNGGRNRLLLWETASASTVRYRDASSAFTPEMANGWTLAMAAADLDGDLLPEIYVANDFGPDRLLHNRSRPGKPAFDIVEGRRGWTTPRSKVLGQDSFKGMGVDFGSITGDGRLAIAVSNISSPYALLESHFLFVHSGDDTAWSRGEAPYVDRSWSYGTWTSGWAWDLKFADLTNSGRPAIIQAIGFLQGRVDRWPELQEEAMANDELLAHPGSWPRFRAGDDLSGHDHDRIWLMDAQGKYHDVWTSLGLSGNTVSRGVAVGDVYGDGRLSIAIARQWMPSVFLRNAAEHVGRSLSLDIRVPGINGGYRAAIGAKVTARLPNGALSTGQVDGGSGHSGKRPSEVHIGLGDVNTDDVIETTVEWRDAKGRHHQAIRLPAGRYRLLLNGDAPIMVQGRRS
jgi:hypothetical protein